MANKDVFIVTYGSRGAEFAEHDVPGLRMPEGCKRSIADWFDRLRASVTAR